MQQIGYQKALMPRLPEVEGNVDYKIMRARLDRIDDIIRRGQLEESFVEKYLQRWLEEGKQEAQREGRAWKEPSARALSKQVKMASQAFRCNIARELLSMSLRDFSTRLADSPLLQRFIQLARLGVIRVPTKSTLQRWENLVPQEVIRSIIDQLILAAASPAGAEGQVLGLEEVLVLDEVFMDLTCVKANIHYPVDWVLLRDATRTLMKATLVIRSHGLHHRMEDPSAFLKRMNQLCIQMTQSQRRQGGKKERKRIFRLMKKLMKVIRRHALRHRNLLLRRWEETDLKQGHVNQIVKRIDEVLDTLPAAIHLAHERIIGERQVDNDQKILSLYERDLLILVRGKAGEEVEFGNPMLLVENRQGVIIDWDFLGPKDEIADTAQLPKSLARLEAALGRYPKKVSTDRGFDSKKNQRLLKTLGIYNALCPKDPGQLRQRIEEDDFTSLQQRRSQTEGRIGIFKNCFLGRPLRSKGFMRRLISVAWAVLAHNLWVIARLPTAQEKAAEKKIAA